MTDYFTDTEEVLDGPPPFVAGERLAPGYEVIAHMSRGNNLDVYDAWSEERACRVIAKTPRPDRLEDRRTVRALMREGRLLKKFTHPHVRRWSALRLSLMLSRQDISLSEGLRAEG